MDAVTSELDLIDSYRSKLIQAQVAVKRARNNLANVPINSLPAEVLAHIFHLVLAQQSCPLHATDHWDMENPVTFPKYPDALSHVCSRWRQIALASRVLWSHIDIALSCPLSRGFHDRAEAYVVRAHPMPLDIHLIDPGRLQPAEESEPAADDTSSGLSSLGAPDRFDEWDDLMYDNNPEEFTFLSSSEAPYIRTLGLLVHYEYHPIHSRAMEHCLANCLLGSLSELTVHVPNEGYTTPTFFETRSDSSTSTYLCLSEQQLERVWHSVTTLHLQGKYPPWASTAYHGLADLRLSGGRDISSSNLVNILKASPGLRILHCDFRISDSPSSGASVTPVSLQELETLDLKEMSEADVGCFLQWLKPGSKPLQLSFRGNPTSSMLEGFFSRSNVQELRVKAEFRYSGAELPSNMFYLPPQLRILVIANWGRSTFYGSGGMYPPLGVHETSPPLELDELYMLSCCYDNFHIFRETVQKYSPRRLILWACNITHSGGRYLKPIDLPLLESAIGKELSQNYHSIECLGSGDPRPLEGWD
ncbi:hypothetical protein FRC11_013015 [Ceratobasidium sp. 423]|nr:hypothetical protein FRC11_013015 [Ceratobasidium sp. 423]